MEIAATFLAKAFVAAQGKLKVALKDSTNPHFKSKYADLASIWAACRDVLSSNGLAVIQAPVDVEGGRVGMKTILIHESGEIMELPIFSTAIAKNDPQGVGSAITYLKRYSLSAALGVVSDDDDDGNAASLPPKENKYETSSAKYSKPVQAKPAAASASVSNDGGSNKGNGKPGNPAVQPAVSKGNGKLAELMTAIDAAHSPVEVSAVTNRAASEKLSVDEMKKIKSYAVARNNELAAT